MFHVAVIDVCHYHEVTQNAIANKTLNTNIVWLLSN